MKTGQVIVTKTKAKQLTGYSSFSSVWVKALPDNSAPVFVGDASVSHDSGYPLAPGEELKLDKVHPDKIHVISPSTGQMVGFLVV